MKINHSRPNPGRREKINLNFYFPTFLCASGFVKASKAFIKPFDAPQRCAKIRIKLIFTFIQISEMQRAGRLKDLTAPNEVLTMQYLRKILSEVISKICTKYDLSSVIRQKGDSQNLCYKKTKLAKFSEKRTLLFP